MVLGVSVAAQTLLFLKSILLGACLMLLYDGFRILRLAVKTPAAIVLVEDILFFLICALATMLFLISANFGEIRFFALLGEGMGALLCALTLSRMVMACSKAIIGFVRAVFRVVFRLFFRPVYRIIHSLALQFVRFTGFLGAWTQKSCRKANYGLKSRRVLLYNLIISGHKERQAAHKRKRAQREGMIKHEAEKGQGEEAAGQ